MVYKQEKHIARFWIYLVVILLSLITTIGMTLDAVPEQITIITYIKAHKNSVLALSIITFFCYSVIVPIVFKKIDAITMHSCSSLETEENCKFKKSHCFKYIAIIFLCWLPYLVITYPTITAGYDFFWQLLQGVGAFPLSNHHPVIGSIVYGVLYSIGYKIGGAAFGLFFISFLQVVFMASVLGWSVSVLIDMGIHTNVGRIILLIICFNPIFPTNAIWLIKDSIFTSLCILFFFQIFTNIWCKYRSIKVPFIASLPMITAVGIAFSLYRNGVKIIAIIMLLLIVVATIKNSTISRKEKRKQLEHILASCIVYIVVILGFNLWTSGDDIYPTNIRETMSLPSRCIMHYVELWSDEVTEKEYAVLEEVYKDSLSDGSSVYDLSKKYDNINADPIKISYVESNDTIVEYIKVFVSMGLKHPGTFVDAVLHGTNGYWWYGLDPRYVVRIAPLDMVENDFAKEYMKTRELSTLFLPTVKSLEYNNIDTSQTMGTYLSDYPQLTALFDIESTFPEVRQSIERIINKIKSIPIVSLFFVPGTYLCMILVSLAYLFSRKKEGRYTWPIILIVVLACLSPINGYTRYVLPVELFAILLVGICFIPDKMIKRNQ